MSQITVEKALSARNVGKKLIHIERFTGYLRAELLSRRDALTVSCVIAVACTSTLRFIRSCFPIRSTHLALLLRYQPQIWAKKKKRHKHKKIYNKNEKHETCSYNTDVIAEVAAEKLRIQIGSGLIWNHMWWGASQREDPAGQY